MYQRLNTPSPSEAQRTEKVGNGAGSAAGTPAGLRGPRGSDSWPGSEEASGLDCFPATGSRPGFRFNLNDEVPKAGRWPQSPDLIPGHLSIKRHLPGSPLPLGGPFICSPPTEGLSPQPVSLPLPPA